MKSGTVRARLSAERGATAISLFRKAYEKLTRLIIGVGVAELQKALEDGMLVCGRNLHGDTGMLSHKVGHVTWTTGVAVIESMMISWWKQRNPPTPLWR